MSDAYIISHKYFGEMTQEETRRYNESILYLSPTDRNTLASIISDPASILRRICSSATRLAKKTQGRQPEYALQDLLYHGSGMSKAIYHIYGKKDDPKS